MKTATSLVALLACTFGVIAMAVANTNQDGIAVSVLAPPAPPALRQNTFTQDPVVPPVPLEPAPQAPVPVPPGVVNPGQSVMMDPVVVYQPMIAAPVSNGCCQTCSRRRCRCTPPPPVPTMFCLVDPCGCSHEACVDVPVCCVGEQPIVSWRDGVLDRQVATLCWACCDHKVKVIVTNCGKIRVRD